MSDFTIVVDCREQKPYHFRRYPVDTIEKRLETGDYCVLNDGRKISDESFDPHYAVERKSGPDFLKSITWERDRFEDELARADSFAHRMPIVVEEPWGHFENQDYYQNVSFNSIAGTIEYHPKMYNVEYFFNRDRRKAEQATYEFLKWRYTKLEERV